MDKILIIEDDPDIAAIERDYLELSGCAVTICANGTDGQRAALEGAFDLILLDLMCSRGRTGFPSAAPCAHRRTFPSSWSRRSARTPTRSTASASARTTTSKSPRRTPRIRSCCRRSGAWGTGCERTMNRPEPFYI